MNMAKKILKEWIIPFGIEIIILLLIVKFVCFFTIVPTGSMKPTIAEKSIVFTLRVRNPEKLKRGEIVVFFSEELGQNLVKRLVGLPGEHVEIDEEGMVYIDGEKLEENYVVYQSGLTGEFEVPQGCYLFLGDNRAGSLDARYWDEPYISGDDITGKAIFTIWPFSNFGVLS